MKPTLDAEFVLAADRPPQRARRDLNARFWRFVDKSHDDACWPWRGFCSTNGYGQFSFQDSDRKTRRVWAHRCAYLLAYRSIPDNLYLDHLCRHRTCVNPSHLEPVSLRENLLRGETRAANNHQKTHCPSGHSYDGDNLYVHGGHRFCRICIREHGRKYDKKRRVLTAEGLRIVG